MNEVMRTMLTDASARDAEALGAVAVTNAAEMIPWFQEE